MNIGKTIKELREEREITQEKLAEMIGVTQDSISLWEKNKRIPNTPYIIALCKVFNISSDYLLGLENDDGSRSETSYEFEYDHNDTHLKHKETK